MQVGVFRDKSHGVRSLFVVLCNGVVWCGVMFVLASVGKILHMLVYSLFENFIVFNDLLS